MYQSIVMAPHTSHNSPDMTSSTARISWHGEAPSLPRHSWGRAKAFTSLFGWSTDISIVYKQGGIRPAAFSNANWGNNPDDGKSTSSHIVILAKSPIWFWVGLQGLTAQTIREEELVAAARTIQETVSCNNIMNELRFKGGSTVFLSSTTTRRRLTWPAIASTSLGQLHCAEVLLS